MSDEKKAKVLTIGFYVGQDYFGQQTQGDLYPQVAAFKLERRFLQAILSADYSVEVISTVAISTFPKGKKIKLPRYKFEEQSMPVDVAPFINLPLLKFLTRGASIFLRLIKKKKSLIKFVCVYSVHLPNLIPAYIYSLMFRVPFFVYVPDLPRFMAGTDEGHFRALLRRLNSWMCELLVSASAGVFVVTRFMVEDIERWQKLPFMVLEGIADGYSEVPVKPPQSRVNYCDLNKDIVLYAGGVAKKYGVLELVEGFLQANLNAELWICGRGDMEEYLYKKTANDSRIKYFGFISPTEVSRLQDLASCLVITRDPAELYTRYSFPSKLIEYMVSGKPVLTTCLEGIPNDYYRFLTEIKTFSSKGVCDALLNFFGERGEAIYKARLGRDWVLENKVPKAVGIKIKSFLEVTLD